MRAPRFEDPRFDLPKGHIKKNETEIECALRELEEETGIAAAQIRLVDGFRSTTTYRVSKGAQKTVVLFVAEMRGPSAVITPDHDDYAWVPWALGANPPREFSDHPTIHGALQAWHAFEAAGRRPMVKKKAS